MFRAALRCEMARTLRPGALTVKLLIGVWLGAQLLFLTAGPAYLFVPMLAPLLALGGGICGWIDARQLTTAGETTLGYWLARPLSRRVLLAARMTSLGLTAGVVMVGSLALALCIAADASLSTRVELASYAEMKVVEQAGTALTIDKTERGPCFTHWKARGAITAGCREQPGMAAFEAIIPSIALVPFVWCWVLLGGLWSTAREVRGGSSYGPLGTRERLCRWGAPLIIAVGIGVSLMAMTALVVPRSALELSVRIALHPWSLPLAGGASTVVMLTVVAVRWERGDAA